MLKKQADRPEYVARAVYSALLTSVGMTRQANREEMARQEGARIDEIRAAHRDVAASMSDPARHSRVPVLIRQGGPIYSDSVPVGFDEGMVRVASAVGEELAKLAFPGNPTQMLAAAKNVVENIKATGALSAKSLVPKAPAFQGFGRVMKPGEAPLAAPRQGLVPVGKAPAATPMSPARPPALPQTASPYRAPAPQAPAELAKTQPAPAAQELNKTQPATPDALKGGPAPEGKPGQPEKPGVFGRLQEIYSSGKLPGQLLGLGAVAAAGYGGYKLLSKGLEAAGKEHGPAVYGRGGPQVPWQVNQYGEPQY